MSHSQYTLRRFLRLTFILSSATNWQWLINTDLLLHLIRSSWGYVTDSWGAVMWGTTGGPNVTCSPLSPEALFWQHISWPLGVLGFSTSLCFGAVSSLTSCWHWLAQRTLKIKSSFPVTGEKGLLSSQLLCWVCWNILSFAKYKLLKFRRNSGAADQFSAVYHKWSCLAGRRGGGPVSPTRCRETLTTWTHTMFYIKGPLGLTLRGLRLQKQNKTSSL